MARGRNSQDGFTLIEVLIVVAISALLAAIAIAYSGVARNQTALSVEETKISQFILQARTLSVATYGTAGICGYGVLFNASGTYSIFAYTPSNAPPCPPASDITPASIESSERKYTDETWQVHPANNVILSGGNPDALAIALFYPPDPTTFLIRASDMGSFAYETSNIYLVTADGSLSKTIKVNSAGQITL